jgi:hypothetical protein
MILEPGSSVWIFVLTRQFNSISTSMPLILTNSFLASLAPSSPLQRNYFYTYPHYAMCSPSGPVDHFQKATVL